MVVHHDGLMVVALREFLGGMGWGGVGVGLGWGGLLVWEGL